MANHDTRKKSKPNGEQKISLHDFEPFLPDDLVELREHVHSEFESFRQQDRLTKLVRLYGINGRHFTRLGNNTFDTLLTAIENAEIRGLPLTHADYVDMANEVSATLPRMVEAVCSFLFLMGAFEDWLENGEQDTKKGPGS